MFKRFMSLLAGVGLVAATLIPTATVSAQPRDCDNNAILRCGAYSVSELHKKMDQHDDAEKIYAYYGISKDDLKHTVNGTVHKNGNVVVDGKVVATDARSTGRQNIPGAGTSYIKSINVYERPTQVSFRSDSLSAFVRMKDGKYQYAVIKSCGNPVKAKPVEPPKEEKPPVKPVEEPKKPDVSIEKTVSKDYVKEGEMFYYRIVVRNIGEVVLKDAVVTDDAPDGVEFVPNGDITETDFNTTIPELRPGRSKSYTIRASMTKYVEGYITNTACVEASEVTHKDEVCDDAVHQMKKVVTPVTKPEPPKELPVTGPGLIIGAASSVSMASYVGAMLYGALKRRYL
jgi:uncharacterized repeat protein (TIGR01451 family)